MQNAYFNATQRQSNIQFQNMRNNMAGFEYAENEDNDSPIPNFNNQIDPNNEDYYQMANPHEMDR